MSDLALADLCTNPEEYQVLSQIVAETAYWFAGDFTDLDPSQVGDASSHEQLHDGLLAEFVRDAWKFMLSLEELPLGPSCVLCDKCGVMWPVDDLTPEMVAAIPCNRMHCQIVDIITSKGAQR